MSRTPRKHRTGHRLATSLIAGAVPVLIVVLYADLDPAHRKAAHAAASTITAARGVAVSVVAGLIVFVVWSAAAAWRRAAARAREAERRAASPSGRRRRMAGVR